MNINSLTIKAQETLQEAFTLAKESGNQAVEPMHLLSVLVREDDSLATFLLGAWGSMSGGCATRRTAPWPRCPA